VEAVSNVERRVTFLASVRMQAEVFRKSYNFKLE